MSLVPAGALVRQGVGVEITSRWARTVAAVAVVAASAVLGGCVGPLARVDVREVFPDPGLGTCVAAALGDPGSTTVSASRMQQLSTLSCPLAEGSSGAVASAPVRHLDGIERLPALRRVSITGGFVTDLEPLTGLGHLTSLDLGHNGVRDLGPLAQLRGLRTLELADNQVTDLSPLSGLTDLSRLVISGNAVSDLAPLAGLTRLEVLDASSNRVSDLRPLSGLAVLDRLTLSENLVTDAAPLSPLRLRMLDLHGNRLTSTDSLTGLPVLDELWLGANPLTDVRSLVGLPALVGVDLREVDTTRVTGVEEVREHGVYVGGGAK